jgi:hypothetical protein
MFQFNSSCFHVIRTSYFLHQEDSIVHAALYGMLFMHLCKQSNLKSAFCWLTSHNCITMHSTKNIKMCLKGVVPCIFIQVMNNMSNEMSLDFI